MKENHKYDYIIVGAGITGLYTAYNLIKKFPDARICILEASNRAGGRLHSIRFKGSLIEAGGARFNTNQHRILKLIHELGLDSKKVPIKSNIKYIPINRKYDPQLETLFPTIDDIIRHVETEIKKRKITNRQLINTTLLELTYHLLHKQYPTIKTYIESCYPYYSELARLNALEGIHLFTNEFASESKYFILAGGMEQLITELFSRLSSSNNVEIMLNKPVSSITSPNKDPNNHENFLEISIVNTADKSLTARNVILALPKNAIQKINMIHSKILNQLLDKNITTEALYRIYAQYPADKKTGKVWFHDIAKTSTNLQIKYIIPYDYQKGIIMISYTDSKYAEYWLKQLENGTFETELQRQLSLIFPDKNIPLANEYKHCYWDSGAGYWKPGASRIYSLPRINKPFSNENIFIANENFSSHQAWVEGSLESADLVLSMLTTKVIIRRITKKRNVKQNSKTIKKNQIQQNEIYKIKRGGGNKDIKYDLEEVAKHNKKSDAWIVVNGIVADITKWIPLHPGGDAILKGIGKDATALFKAIGHDKYAKKMLYKYKIGILANKT